MRGLELIQDVFTQYLVTYPNTAIDLTVTSAITEAIRPDFIRLLDFTRQLCLTQPVYEAAYQHLAHLFVLGGSRADLRASLERRLRAALAGQSSLVLIEGVAGIGKTSLAMVQQAQAQNLGAAFIVGRCYEQGATPFWLWREVIHAVEVQTGTSFASLPAPFGSGVEARSMQQLIQALGDWLTACAAQQPLVILLDDLHWADSDSLEVLNVLTGHLVQHPLLFMATYRSEETGRGHPLYRYLPLLNRNRAIETLRLQPLTRADTAQLATAYQGSCHPHLADYLYQRAEGHPLFTVELLHSLVDQGFLSRNADGLWLPPDGSVPVPTLLQQVILQRVARLGEAAEKLLFHAAVVGESWSLMLVETLVELPEDVLLDTVENAVKADLIRLVDEQSEEYRFSHGLIREVLYMREAARRRKRLHARIGVALETQQPFNLAGLAYHFYEGEIAAKAYEYCLKAGDEARQRFAGNSAVSFYQQALNAAKSADDTAAVVQLYERIGRAWRLLERRPEAEDAFTQMRDAAMSTGDLLAVGQALAELVSVRISLYQFDSADETAREVLEFAERTGDAALLARVHNAVGKGDIARGRLEEARHHAVQALHFARAAGSTYEASRACRDYGYEAIWRGRYTEAEAYARRAFDLAYESKDLLAISAAHQILSYIQVEMGQYLQAHRTLSTMLVDDAVLQPHHHQLPRLFNQMGYLYLELGAAADALVWDRRALAASRNSQELSNREMERYSLLNIATDLLHLNRRDEALEVIAEFEAIKDMTEFSRFRYFNRYQLLMTEVHLARQEFDRAIGLAREARELAQSRDILKNIARSWLYEGLALVGLARYDDAIPLMRDAVKIVDQIQHGSLRWKMRFHLAQTHALAGLPNAAILQKALELIAEAARSLQGSELAGIFAKSAFVQALQAEPQLTATAESSKAVFPDGLTLREVEVLRQVASGATDRQIADVLHISVRTVNTHITNILNKINRENRTAATAYAIQQRLV